MSRGGLDFLQGWLLELALSADNVFVFVAILSYFKVNWDVQHKVLFWGILGEPFPAVLFIIAGAATIHAFHWVLYLLGAFLVFTLGQDPGPGRQASRSPRATWFCACSAVWCPLRPTIWARLFARHEGRLMATPLLAVLVVVEAADAMFAVDSIPAISGVTTDVFIVFTSNIFAVLGHDLDAMKANIRDGAFK